MLGQRALIVLGATAFALCSCAKQRPITGMWKSGGDVPIILDLGKDGRLSMLAFVPVDGTYTYRGDTLSLRLEAVAGKQAGAGARESKAKIEWISADRFTMIPDGQLFGGKPIAFSRMSADESQKMRIALAESTSPAPFEEAEASVPGGECASNLKMIARAALMYARDYEGYLPPSHRWQDSLGAYLESDAALSCPSAGQHGYAFNAELSGANVEGLQNLDMTVLVFESDDKIPNASSSPGLSSAAPRHKGKNNVAYLDGRVGSDR